MVADFREYYGMDLPVSDDGEVPDMARCALLWKALPESSRCVRRLVPEARWSQEDYLLRAIEHDLRVIVWQWTKDGQKNVNAPKPISTPAETARNKGRRDRAMAARDEIDRILGIGR